MFNEQEIVNKLREMFNPDFEPFYNISINENKGAVKSIVINCPGTFFHDPVENALFARIQINGKNPYISFKDKYAELFKAAEIPFYTLKSETDFLRIDLATFCVYLDNPEILRPIMQSVLVKVFSFAPFGCCDRFEKCSDAKKCLHSDMVYATACQYGKNLATGKIFYGKNRNV